MDTEEEKNAGLFADVVEYREAIAALAEFGPGFEVLVARRWKLPEPPIYTVHINKLHGDATDYPVKDWTSQGSGATLLEAARDAAQHARIAAAYAKRAQEAAAVSYARGHDLLTALGGTNLAVGQVGPQDIAGGLTFAGAVSEEPGKAP